MHQSDLITQNQLKSIYRTLNLEWSDHCEAIDRLRLRLNNNKKRNTLTPLIETNNNITLNNNQLTNQITQQQPVSIDQQSIDQQLSQQTTNQLPSLLSRTTRRNAPSTTFGVGDAVTDAQFENVLVHLGTEDLKDPIIRSFKSQAKIPDMIILNNHQKESKTKKEIEEFNKITLIKDPISYYDLNLNIKKNWTKEEIKEFELSYINQPKQFGFISKKIKTKSRSECVLFYYQTKNKLKYRNLLSTSLSSSSSNNNNNSNNNEINNHNKFNNSQQPNNQQQIQTTIKGRRNRKSGIKTTIHGNHNNQLKSNNVIIDQVKFNDHHNVQSNKHPSISIQKPSPESQKNVNERSKNKIDLNNLLNQTSEEEINEEIVNNSIDSLQDDNHQTIDQDRDQERFSKRKPSPKSILQPSTSSNDYQPTLPTSIETRLESIEVILPNKSRNKRKLDEIGDDHEISLVGNKQNVEINDEHERSSVGNKQIGEIRLPEILNHEAHLISCSSSSGNVTFHSNNHQEFLLNMSFHDEDEINLDPNSWFNDNNDDDDEINLIQQPHRLSPTITIDERFADPPSPPLQDSYSNQLLPYSNFNQQYDRNQQALGSSRPIHHHHANPSSSTYPYHHPFR
ncbi:hypothetical protein CROQUDRAFT_99148 [Cronartium quercuum f. sp. fusiforme G11]|uniref:SANT domain-containing protein n=1 Tax=Cronartium quercuum f. sp. fusiforme G11 TaxID=708437 RepID=A0A9P6N781_9BASI|nr:hypothetical protein CROQUDRAFT_99148 [Cronartium quercuum f. sp. fusiforme G11]